LLSPKLFSKPVIFYPSENVKLLVQLSTNSLLLALMRQRIRPHPTLLFRQLRFFVASMNAPHFQKIGARKTTFIQFTFYTPPVFIICTYTSINTLHSEQD
jgi:hypothetical protein